MPHFFQTEDRYKKALDESILKLLKDAFGGEVPEYRLAMAPKDYENDPGLHHHTLKLASDMFERFLKVIFFV